MQVLGMVDVFNFTRISGWVFEKDSEDSVEVILKHNDSIIAKTVANIYRKDLEEKEIHPSGHCGFIFDTFQVDQDISLFDLKVEVLATSIVIEPTPEIKKYLSGLLFDPYINKEKASKKPSRICYLHVGMHKTGSSSIQEALFNHKFISSTKYLNIGVANHSIPFYSLLTENPEQYHINRRGNRNFYDCLKFNQKNLEIIDQYISKSEENIIISGEDISVLPTEKLETLKKFLVSYFDSVQILIYIRSPHSFMSSGLQELIKNGLSGDGFDMLFSGTLYPSYQKIISKFDYVFGRSNVEIRLFDKEHLRDGDIVQDFISTIGLQENIPSSTVNTSLSLEELSIFYIFNKYYIKGRDMNKDINNKSINLIDLVKPLALNKFKISKNLTKEVIIKNLQDIEWVSHRVNIDIEDLMEFSDDDEKVIISAMHLEDIGWKQLKRLVNKLEGSKCEEEKLGLLNRFVNIYL
ncbi:hypothetical protein [Psychrobacter celer]|uniref:hypothetical protein n=1 Tax=Psychrobacter celer TaxID=306572 RepID=UPI003FD09979